MVDLPNSKYCPHCERYFNRGVTIDAVIIKDNKVLLIKRGTQPDRGFWAVPGGYVNWNESVEDSVRREVKEETNLDVKQLKLIGVYSSPKRHPKQLINITYLVGVSDGRLKHGDDALDAKWVKLEDLPDKLALDHREIIEDAKRLLA